MRVFRILGFSLLLSIPLHAAPPKSVAIVYSLAGTASLTAPSAARRPLQLFDRFPAGIVLEVGPGSRVALAFVNGLRYELGERSRVTLGRKDFTSRTGPVRPLPRVPPLPDLAPIAAADRPGPRAGAVRIRGERIEKLSPGDGAVTLADATILCFQTAEGAKSYEVEIENSRGKVIFHTVADSPTVSVPAGILAAGSRYHWTVKTQDRPGPIAFGEAGFVTLSRKASESRERLRKAAEAAGDSGLRDLLDAVDHGLGLADERDGAGLSAGVVIEKVRPRSPAEAAGLQPGDVLLSWSCPAVPPAFPEPSRGRLSSPYELLPLEIEEAPRRAVTLRGERASQEKVWTLPSGEWGIATRPGLTGDLAALYSEGKAKTEAGDLAAAERSWRSAAESARNAGNGRLAAWFLNRLARALADAGKWPEADATYKEALAALERETEHPAAAQLLRHWASTFERRGDFDAAIEHYQKALTFDQKTVPNGLAVARTLNNLGVATAKKGDHAAAQKLLRQALEIREKLAPGTVEVTGSLNNLGILARRSGNLTAAEEYLTKGEELQRRIAPDSSDRALFFQNLGNLALDRGDLEKAESFQRQALAIFEKTDPGGDGVLDCLGNLASVVMQRGDLITADDLLQRSLSLMERRVPDPSNVSSTLILLGHVASRRGDLDMAEVYYRRAMAINEKLFPNADNDPGLGFLMAQRGDFATARAYLQHSLAVEEKNAPESLALAPDLEQLGRLELMDSRGDLAAAENLFRRALAILEKEAPESLDLSDVLRDLGEVAVRRGHLPEAIALHRRALDLQRKLAPETTGEAEALYFLGRAKRRAGLSKEGTQDLCNAIDVLDRQRPRLGGTPEARTSFEATLGDYYSSCLDGLLQAGRSAEAFHVLERGRARSFLSLLAERDIRLSGLSPELAAERRNVDTQYDRVQAELASSRDDPEIERLTGELRDLRIRQDEIRARIRRESPHFAALQDPEPLDLAGVRAALDPGTVLLEYIVGPEGSWLFVVQSAGASGPGLSVFPIAASAKALREKVESFRRLLKNPGSDRAALQGSARHLYSLLVHPAEKLITRAQRILISPDGPLHTLPFAALMQGDRYLIDRKPIHSALSATVYAELVRSRPAQRKPEEERLAAFGDPIYPPVYPPTTPDAPADPEIQEAVRRGLTLKPLPSTRKEVEAITAIYPQSKAYLGREATEERAKSLGPESRLIHFACHGLLDERFPLNSSLALTLPREQAEGQDNGLLQAWEIFERVRLNADLVTLSACDTALGREMGGEGLVGLTRAFQYAGARSVLASVWGISDLSTARFMQRFYGYLRGGKTKDEALRAAQIDQIRGKSGSSHPFYWAAFQLTGDWN